VEEQGDHVLDIADTNRILLDVYAFFEHLHVPFWLMFGTFLGIYREGRLILYDKDIDLAIYEEDFPLLLSHVSLLKDLGFSGHLWETRVTLYRESEHVDIYFFKHEGSKRVWLDQRIDGIDFETVNLIEYLGKSWRVLNNPEKWLQYIYGDTWRIPIVGLQAQTYPRGGIVELGNTSD